MKPFQRHLKKIRHWLQLAAAASAAETTSDLTPVTFTAAASAALDALEVDDALLATWPYVYTYTDDSLKKHDIKLQYARVS